MEGESEAETTLRTMEITGTILRNLHLPTNKGTTTEVDLVWISHKGVFVLEVKNYSGWIFGNERNQYWTQVLKGGLKNQFYNPIRQNGGHIAAVRGQLWRFYKGPYFNIIVFSDHCTLKDVTFHSDNTAVIQQHQLDEYLYKTTWRLPTIIDQRRIDQIASILSQY